MRSGERKVFIIQIVSLIILLLNTIYHEFLSDISLIVFLFVMFISLHFACGIPRDNNYTKKISVRLCLFYSLAFLILEYSLGLITGYYRNPYNLSLVGILKNIIPAILLIVFEEYCRFTMVEKSGRNKIILLTTIFLFTLINFALFGTFVNITTWGSFLRLFTTEFMIWLFYNIGLTTISYKHGLKTALVYAFIFYLYRYLMPILPGFGEYVNTMVNMLIPIIIIVLLHIGVPEIFKKKKNKEDIRDKHLISKLIGVVLFTLILVIVFLNSNLFRYWACVVGSGSMDPTIQIGDIIIVDKSYKNRVNSLQKGDIIVFRIGDKYYTHRIIEIVNSNGEKSFITKGDREGQAVDNWIVTKNEVVGLTKYKFKYIGLPSIWIRDFMKEK